MLDYKEDNTKKQIHSLGCFFISFLYIIFGVLFLSFIVCSIVFLIIDFNVSKICANSNLWEYILISLIFLFLKILLLSKTDFFGNIRGCKSILLLGIQLSLLIFGYLETFNTECEDLKNLDIWKLSIVTIVIQFIFTIIYLYLFLANLCSKLCWIKTPCCCVN